MKLTDLPLSEISLSDFELSDRKKLDEILIQLCDMIIQKQREDSDFYGRVAACVLDDQGNEIKAINFKHNDKRIHAEMAAILKYERTVGPLTPDCIIVTTLSPCSEYGTEMADERYGESCTDVINDSPVRKVYCGYSDPIQDHTENYEHKKFHIEVTRNKTIHALCKKIADTFLKEPVNEVNANTIRGSEGPGLPEFRSWSLDVLKKIKNKFDTIYILGSWYGNLSLMIAEDSDIGYDRIFNVETDKSVLETGAEIAEKLGHDFIEPMHKDANKLDYRMLGENGLVINQSCTDIDGDQWFKNIPDGTMVLLTGRNNNPKAIKQFTSAGDLAETFPLNKILYAGKKEFTDPETDYDGYLLIGIK